MAQPDNATFEQTAQEVCRVALNFLPLLTDKLRMIKRSKEYRMFFVLWDLRRALPDLEGDPDTADRVLQRVLDNCPPKCAWMVAVVYGRMDTLFRLANKVANKTLGLNFLKTALMWLSHWKKWSSITDIFDHCPHLLYSRALDLHSSILHLENEPAGVEVFARIMLEADISDHERLSSFVVSITQSAKVEHFKVVVNDPRPAVRQVVVANLEYLMTEVCMGRMKHVLTPAPHDGFFMAAAQAGLFAVADPTTCTEYMAKAAVANQPDLVLCLHHCGTLGARDFSAMLGRDKVKAMGSKHPIEMWGIPRRRRPRIFLPFDDEAKKTAFDIKSFLAKQASTPSTLKKMCLQHLYRQAGWGHGREERIREMGIPDSLRDELRFKGLERMMIKK